MRSKEKREEMVTYGPGFAQVKGFTFAQRHASPHIGNHVER